MNTARSANMTWQRGGDAAALRKLAEGNDVLLLVECRTRDNKPLDVARILGPEWRVWQDLRSAARAGTVIAIRKGSGIKRKRVRSVLLSRAGVGVQARYMKIAVFQDEQGRYSEAVLHNPLKGTHMQDDAMRVAEAWWARTKGRKRMSGDVNMDPGTAADQIGARHFQGAHPMVQMWSAGWENVQKRKLWVKPLDHWVLQFRAGKS